jgi:hypothetical protein
MLVRAMNARPDRSWYAARQRTIVVQFATVEDAERFDTLTTEQIAAALTPTPEPDPREP